ncbi:PQQ-binding-like beta-propeller repeat protein, partial [bacterium]|nr:PQQ-binding-like beta-propeller repeat protein [bacterium]
HVISLSIDDGTINWNQIIKASDQEQQLTTRISDHGYSSPTACVDEDNVYAFFGPSGIIAHTRSGEYLWRSSVGTGTAGFGAAASPIVYQDLIIMNGSIESGAVYGLDKHTGEIRWKTDGIQRAWTTPTIVSLPSGQDELILNQKGAILGLEPTTGKEKWRCEAIQDYVVPCVIADGDTIYCSGGRSNMTFAVRAGGKGDVTDTHLLWDVQRGANVTSPVLVNDYLYWSHDKAIALCLRASDGEEMFRERLPTRSRVYASIVSDGKKLFLTTRDAGVLVLAANPTYQELAINQVGNDDEKFNATPAIAGDRLILRSDQAVYCIKEPSRN